MEAATIAASRRDENGLTGSSSGSGVLGDVFAEVLRVIGKQRNQGSSRAASVLLPLNYGLISVTNTIQRSIIYGVRSISMPWI